MKIKYITYSLLSLFGFAMVYQFIPIGDYCGGLINGLLFILFGGLLIISCITIYIINLWRYIKKKQSFDLVPLLLTIIFSLCGFYIIEHDNQKFWTEEVYIGHTEMIQETSKDGRLILYKNGSFAATYFYSDYSCTFQGSYDLQNGHLLLKRDDLSQVTEALFTTEYKLHAIDSIFYPILETYGVIKLSKVPD